MTLDTIPTRMRVERCIGGDGYAPGWIVMHGDGSRDYCIHEDHDIAFACAMHRATEMHHGS